MARVVFLGTPEAAVPTLRALNDEHDVALVVTQPDRPRGRSKRLQPPPVKVWAEEVGIVVEQPERSDEIGDRIAAHGHFDVGVVVAYGQILDETVLEMPDHGLLNVHFSLLPRWRGAAPVARAIMEGDPMTGVTIMKLDPGLDTGPILTAQAVDIGEDEDAGSLTETLASTGARLLVDNLDAFLSGSLAPQAQTDEGATYAGKLTPADRPLDLRESAEANLRRIRALAPVPGATLIIDGAPHKILAARQADGDVSMGEWRLEGARPVVGFGRGALEIVALQPPGKKPMAGADWARGRQLGHGVAE